jgi:A/G-specific adenine glycosylase
MLPGMTVESKAILAWYDQHRRTLPWRAAPGLIGDPYHVWLSEIMLQQTTVATVGTYFQRFVQTWPRLQDLAAAPLDDVLSAWAGLGYYARARNLHACAKEVVARFGGQFPADEALLLSLPGIGPYTAAAIAAIAFDIKASPVDGNIERVTARRFAITTPLPAAKIEIKARAAEMTPAKRPGDFAQALMDLGAMICTPKRPNCVACPLVPNCLGYKQGIADMLPVKPDKTARPTRYGTAFVAIRSDGAVLLRRRPEKGLLGGMMEVPSSDWLPDAIPTTDQAAPLRGNWRPVGPQVEHVFTHFRLILDVMRADDLPIVTPVPGPNDQWVGADALGTSALPTVMRKVLGAAGIKSSRP